MSQDKSTDAGSHGTLTWTIRTVGIAGFVGLAAIQYLARPSQHGAEPHRVAQATMRGVVEPETTGSIAQGARSVRFDPCGGPLGARTSHP